MAYYIAELMTKAEHVGIEKSADTKNECFEAILQLWKHRASLPNGHRPLERVEHVINALASLSPENDSYRYLPLSHTPTEQDEVEDAEKVDNTDTNLLQLAEGIDYTARLLIRYFLAQAAAAHQDDAKDWLDLARSIGAQDDPAVVALPTLDQEHSLMTGESREEAPVLLLRERVERLESFVSLASQVASEMRVALREDRG